MIRGNGFMSLPMRGLPPQSLEGRKVASPPSLHLCTCHTSRISYPCPHLKLQLCPFLGLSTKQQTPPPALQSPSHPGSLLSILTSLPSPSTEAAGDWHYPRQGTVPSSFLTTVSIRPCDNHILRIQIQRPEMLSDLPKVTQAGRKRATT